MLGKNGRKSFKSSPLCGLKFIALQQPAPVLPSLKISSGNHKGLAQMERPYFSETINLCLRRQIVSNSNVL